MTMTAGTGFAMPAATAAIRVALTGSLVAHGLTAGLHVAAVVGALAFLAGATISPSWPMRP